jgi:cobalamin biosynthesis Mg chelatase CobN
MALTSEQQARLDVARMAVNSASDAYNNAAQIAASAGEAAAYCQSLRDAKSTGIGKNNACHIDTLTQLQSEWNEKNIIRDNALVLYQDAKRNLDAVLSSIEKENMLAADALKNDPVFNLQTQANILASDKLQNESEQANNKKKVVIFGIIALLTVIIVSLVLFLKRKKNV